MTSVSSVQAFNEKIKDPSVFCFGTGTSDQYKRTWSLVKTLSGSHDTIKSYEVDVDKEGAGEIAAQVGVSRMPVVIVYKGGKKIDEAVRPDAYRIQALIQKL